MVYVHGGGPQNTDDFDFELSDGGEDGSAAASGTFTFTISNENDAPVFSGLDGNPAYVEDSPPVVLDADVTVFDSELSSADDFNGATLTLSRNGGASPDDVFSGSGSLVTLAEGGPLVVGGTTIGTVTTNSGGTLELAFNSNATNALVNTTLQSIAYSNTNQAPSGTVQIDWVLDDSNSGAQGSGGALQGLGSTTVTLSAVNDDPILALGSGDVTYVENSPAILVDGGLTVTDVDLLDFDGAVLSASLTANSTANDVLGIEHQGMGAGQVGVSNSPNTVFYEGVAVGSWSYASGTLAVSFTTAADADAVQAVANQISYANSSEDPSAATRTLELSLTDGDGGVSNTVSKSIFVTPVEDAPTITNLAGDSLSFVEDSGPQVISQGANTIVADVDTSDFSASVLTVQFAAGSTASEDVLSIRNQGVGAAEIGTSGNTISYGGVAIGTFAGGNNGIPLSIQFNGSADSVSIAAVLDNITYENTNSFEPDGTARTVRFELADGEGGVSVDYDTSITITQQNDAPLVSLNNPVLILGEDVDTSVAIRVADIQISDDTPGVNNLSLSGPDAASFEIVGGELRLRAGVNLDFETQATFQVTVEVDDPALAGTPEHSQDFVLTLSDVNEAPTNVVPNDVYVDENLDTSGGVSLGTFTTTDEDAGETFVYSIAGGPDAAFFSVGGAGGDELILDAGVLNFEVKDTYVVQVQSMDSGGNPISRTVTVHVNDLNETPTDISPNGLNVVENTDSSGGLALATLLASDEDFGETFTFTIVGGPDAALFTIGGAFNDELTISDGLLDHERQSEYNVVVRVTDSGGAFYDEQVTVTIDDINDAPVLVAGNGVTDEGGVVVITAAELQATDQDNLDSELVYSVTNAPQHGFLARQSAPATPILSFTQAEIVRGRCDLRP